MAISEKTSKVLWAEAAGRCAFPECGEKLCMIQAGQFSPFPFGEMAHIKGKREGTNRHDPDQSPVNRESYPNLILLCPTHHTIIDKGIR